VFIKAAPQTSERIVIGGVMVQLDRAQGFEFLMDEGQDLRIAFPGIGQHFADDQIGEPLQQLLETGNGQQMVIAVGRFAGTAQRPEGEQAIIDDIESLGFVAEMMLASGFGGWIVLLAAFGIGTASGLVAASVIDIGGS
jgi:hypothetical protein